MAKGPREPLSKKIRFEVFKRDSFSCQYCGSIPPQVVLEVDHLIPISKGGDNAIDNLITSCFNCNRGKSATELSTLPQTTAEKAMILKEKQEQYKAFKKLQLQIQNSLKKEVEEICDVYTMFFEKFTPTERFKVSIKTFISKLGYSEVLDSMEIACSKISDSEKALKYFCGICWNKIKSLNPDS